MRGICGRERHRGRTPYMIISRMPITRKLRMRETFTKWFKCRVKGQTENIILTQDGGNVYNDAWT